VALVTGYLCQGFSSGDGTGVHGYPRGRSMSNTFWKVYEKICMKGGSVNVRLITSTSGCRTAGKVLQQDIAC